MCLTSFKLRGLDLRRASSVNEKGPKTKAARSEVTRFKSTYSRKSNEHRCRDSSTFSSSRRKKFVHQRGVSRLDYFVAYLRYIKRRQDVRPSIVSLINEGSTRNDIGHGPDDSLANHSGLCINKEVSAKLEGYTRA